MPISYDEVRAQQERGTKSCRRCQEPKPLEGYYKQPRMRDGLDSWCKDCHREYRADRYQRTRDKTLEQNKRWAAENIVRVRELAVIKTHRRRGLMRDAAGHSTPEQLAARRTMYGARCWMCGGPSTEMDHVIPLARGGSNWPANLRPACRSCNASKRHFSKGVSLSCQ